MKLFIAFLFIFIFSRTVYASTKTQETHMLAHAGTCYAITHATEVVCSRATGGHKFICTLIGAAASTGANVAYKYREKFPQDTKPALVSGGVGTGLAINMISLDF